MRIGVVFPGQGSQSVGMLAALARSSGIVRDTFAEASTTLGYDLWQLAEQGPAEELNRTECTQPAMLAAGVATWRYWLDAGGRIPDMVCGHSLGEFTALVCAGTLEYSTALELVAFRARAMQEAVPQGSGAMAAILGLEDAAVVAACAEAADAGIVDSKRRALRAGERALAQHPDGAGRAAFGRTSRRGRA